MSKVQQKYKDFVSLVESVSTELYPDWKRNETDSNFSNDLDVLSDVYETAFKREPQAFKGIMWINTEEGLPAWVRPGVEWSSDD